MPSPDKLYIVSRADLGLAQQAVQSVHAQREFTERCRDVDQRWYTSSNHLALLEVDTLEEL